MSKYKRVEECRGWTAENLYKKAVDTSENLVTQFPFLSKVNTIKDDEKKTVSISCSFFLAEVACFEERIELQIEFSFLGRPFQSQLEKLINSWIKKSF